MAGRVHERDDMRMDKVIWELVFMIGSCVDGMDTPSKNGLFILTFALSELLEHKGWMDGAIHSSWIGTTRAKV